MVWIPGGAFLMGSDTHYPEEAPAHQVSVDGFWIDARTVTNRDFARFVAETGHVTVAEKAPDPADYPGAKPEMLIAASTVFVAPTRPVDLGNPYNWWTYAPGADWHHPEGPGSSLAGRKDHPVVHVSWADAVAFACWAGKELPSEAEWEFACRGGLDGATYAWGEEFTPAKTWMANTWQGEFPIHNTVADGHRGTAPVGCYPPNGYGLYDMIGNVWEWTRDPYTGPRQPHANGDTAATLPAGLRTAARRDRQMVIKGGSFLCSPDYCVRYRAAAREAQEADLGAAHIGFRTVLRDG
jgi:formylglycine-generating enzyme required for sulfatase activity